MTWSRRQPPPPPPSGGSTYIDWGPALPNLYGEIGITALVRNPESFFVFWEGGDRIRARDLTDGSVREHAVGWAGSWYFDARPGHEVEIDLLLEGKVVAVSIRIRLPRRDLSDVVDPEWVPTPGQWDLLRAHAVQISAMGRGLEEGMQS